MKARHVLSLCTILVCLSGLALWAAPKASRWTVEDIVLREEARDFAISPDGQWVVWVKNAMDKTKGEEVSNLFLTHLTDGQEFQLTRGTDTHAHPRWSPDGTRIAFLSTRPLPTKDEADVEEPDETQEETEHLWLLQVRGGEPWPLTEDKRPVEDFGWKDNQTLVFLAQEEQTLYEQQIEAAKDTSEVVEDAAHEPPVRLFLLDVNSKTIKRLTANDDWIDMLSVSPDGHWAVARHQKSLSFEFDNKVPPVLELVDLSSGAGRPVAQDKRLLPTSVTWARDSRSFYFTTRYSTDPVFFTATITLLYRYDISDDHLQPVDLGWEWGLDGDDEGRVQSTDDGFIALLADGVRFRPARYRRTADGWTREEISGTHVKHLFDWALAPQGDELVYDHSTPSLPTQWYRAQLRGTRIEGEQQLTRLNPSYADKPLGRVDVVSWTGGGGDKVEGLLYYPIGYEPGKKYPLLLTIHGGPLEVDLDRWFLSNSRAMPLYPQQGSFVLRINYHGGSNYGLAWAESICCGKFYELERVDLANGVEVMVERGLADPDKLGIMGWSNGAILSIDQVLHNPRFKALSAGAGNIEYFGDFGLVSFSATWDDYYFGAAPYNAPELYVSKSPYFKLKEVKVPTLLHTGTKDRAVGPVNAWSHFRILQQETKTPVKLVLFPGEPHELEEFAHRKRKLEEDLAWFKKYLFGTFEPPNEALKEGSPLDRALRRQRAWQVRSRYGVLMKARLVPEVVDYQGMAVGRFEVTRAQFAEFDPSYQFKAGTENLPVNGIRFEQAKAYADWLSQLSGETYRLPTAEEAATLYEASPDTENTLDYWAGYTPNPDDTARLREKIAALPAGAPLLKEVGRFTGRGDGEAVFDLGGNVAEWTTGPNGEAVLAGGSADRSTDPRASETTAGEAYRGFRVVRGKQRQAELRSKAPGGRKEN